MPVLEIRNLKKSYAAPDGVVHPVLDIPSFSLEAGEQVALKGGSGTGKTTLLNVIAGILSADSGQVVVAGRDMITATEAERDAHRAHHIGYVFQTFNLLQGYTALENVVLGMLFGKGPDPVRARELLVGLGLEDRVHHKPRQLSVGQQQRVALARALAGSPELLLADEPTGNLDARRASLALDLIRSGCTASGAALLLVTHDERLLQRFDRRHDLNELNRASQGQAEVEA